jgi:hypothetical protein
MLQQHVAAVYRNRYMVNLKEVNSNDDCASFTEWFHLQLFIYCDALGDHIFVLLSSVVECSAVLCAATFSLGHAPAARVHFQCNTMPADNLFWYTARLDSLHLTVEKQKHPLDY